MCNRYTFHCQARIAALQAAQAAGDDVTADSEGDGEQPGEGEDGEGGGARAARRNKGEGKKPAPKKKKKKRGGKGEKGGPVNQPRPKSAPSIFPLPGFTLGPLRMDKSGFLHLYGVRGCFINATATSLHHLLVGGGFRWRALHSILGGRAKAAGFCMEHAKDGQPINNFGSTIASDGIAFYVLVGTY